MFLPTYIWLVPALAAVPLIRSDLRSRRIGTGWLGAFGAAALLTAFAVYRWSDVLLHAGINSLLTLLSGGCLAGYLRLRYGRRARLTHYFGTGDWVFLLTLAPMFSPADFLRLQIVACLLSLAGWLGRNRRRSTVPFAGVLALTFLGFILLKIIRSWTL